MSILNKNCYRKHELLEVFIIRTEREAYRAHLDARVRSKVQREIHRIDAVRSKVPIRTVVFGPIDWCTWRFVSRAICRFVVARRTYRSIDHRIHRFVFLSIDVWLFIYIGWIDNNVGYGLFAGRQFEIDELVKKNYSFHIFHRIKINYTWKVCRYGGVATASESVDDRDYCVQSGIDGVVIDAKSCRLLVFFAI